MLFLGVALVAVVGLVGGAVYLFFLPADAFTPAHVSVYFPAVSLGSMIVLTLLALRMRQVGVRAFDMLVAAETLVVFGILSLILGIAASIFVGLRSDLAFPIRDIEKLEPVVLPFLEGLVMAGVAPVLANFLRQVEVVRSAPATSVTGAALSAGLDAAAAEIRSLRASVDDLRSAVDGLRSRVEDRKTSLDEVIARSTVAIEDALGRTAMASRSFADNLSTALRPVDAAATHMSEAAKAFKVALDTASNDCETAVGALSASTTALGGAVGSASAELRRLDGLVSNVGTLIENINKFFGRMGSP